MIEGAGGVDVSLTLFYFIGNFSKKNKREKSAYGRAGTTRKDVGKLKKKKVNYIVVIKVIKNVIIFM